MIASIKYRNSKDIFQEKLKDDIRTINDSDKLLIIADKTTNIYSLSPEEHSKLLKDNVTKTYKKAPTKLECSINLKAKHIVNLYGIDKRAECLASTPAFITKKTFNKSYHVD